MLAVLYVRDRRRTTILEKGLSEVMWSTTPPKVSSVGATSEQLTEGSHTEENSSDTTSVDNWIDAVEIPRMLPFQGCGTTFLAT